MWPQNQTRNTASLIHPSHVTTCISPKTACSVPQGKAAAAEGPAILAVVVVCSALLNFAERETIRSTWALDDGGDQGGGGQVQVVFLVGKEPPPQTTADDLVGLSSVTTWAAATLGDGNPFPLPPTTGGPPSSAGVNNLTGDHGGSQVRWGTWSAQQRLDEESRKYGDILQEDFLDTYVNLTIKSLFMLKWFSGSCLPAGASYLLKTDDDVYVNLPNLRSMLEKDRDDWAQKSRQGGKSDDDGLERHLLTGCLICGAVPIRDPSNKWYAPPYMYTGKVYPNYLSGTTYLMSAATANLLYETSMSVPVLHLEDIYVTGVLSALAPLKAGSSRSVKKGSSSSTEPSLRPVDDYRFSYLKAELKPCIYEQLISSHHLSIEEMGLIHQAVTELRRHQPEGPAPPDQGKSKVSGSCLKLPANKIRSYKPGRCSWQWKYLLS